MQTQTPVKKIKVKDSHIRYPTGVTMTVVLLPLGVAIVSVMVNQPQIRASETDISLYDNLVRRGRLLWKGSEGQWPNRDGPHTVNVYVSLFTLQEKLFSSTVKFFFLLCSIHSLDKRLLNVIGWKIWSFLFLVVNCCYCTYLILGISSHFTFSGLEIVREISSSLNRAVRFLLMTFPLTTGHNMFIDSCFCGPLISPSATQFLTAVWAWGGRTL